MPIPVKCKCGKQYRLRDELAGKRAKCPVCGEILTVPLPEIAEFDPLSDALDFEEPAPREPTSARKPAAELTSLSENEGTGLSTPLILALSLCGLVGVVAILLIVFWPSSGAATREQRAAANDPSGATSNRNQNREAAPLRPRHPRLPRAMVKVPSWVSNEAPFDVAEFLQAPSPDANAATIYLDALFEFTEPPQGVFTGAEMQAKLARTRPRAGRFMSMSMKYEQWIESPQFSAKPSGIEELLDDCAAGLDLLRAAQERSECVFQNDLGFASRNEYRDGARNASLALALSALHSLDSGDIARVIGSIESMLRMSRDLWRRADYVTQLASIQVESTRGAVSLILSAPELTAEHCDRLIGLFVSHLQSKESLDPLMESYRAQYVTSCKMLHDLQHNTGEFDPQFMSDEFLWEGPADSPGACLTCFLQRTRYSGFSGQLLRDSGWGDLRGSGNVIAPAKLDDINRQTSAMSANDYKQEIAALNRCYASILALADRTALQRHRELPGATGALRGATIGIFLEPDTASRSIPFMHAQCDARGTICLLALRRWQLTNDDPPSELLSLVQSAGMTDVPKDPFSDQPFGMVFVDDQVVFYSVGPDGTDDQARQQWDGSLQRITGDIIFRLPTAIAEN